MPDEDPSPPELSANGVAIADPLMPLLKSVAIMYPDDAKAQEVARFSFDVSLLSVFLL